MAYQKIKIGTEIDCDNEVEFTVDCCAGYVQTWVTADDAIRIINELKNVFNLDKPIEPVYRWEAIDKNGNKHQYADKPYIRNTIWWTGGECKFIENVQFDNWAESLVEIDKK